MYTAEEWQLVWLCYKFLFMFYIDIAIVLSVVIFFTGIAMKFDKTVYYKNNYLSLRYIIYKSVTGGILWPLTLQEIHKFKINKK